MTEGIIAFLVFIGVMAAIALVLYGVTKISETKDKIKEKKLNEMVNIYEEILQDESTDYDDHYHSKYYDKELEKEYNKVEESNSYNREFKE